MTTLTFDAGYVVVNWEEADAEAGRVHAVLQQHLGGVSNGALALLMANAAVQRGVPLEVFLAVCRAAYAAHEGTERELQQIAAAPPAGDA